MKCYLTGIIIDESNKSLEHILPNALGGVLHSKSILSSDANLALSKEIDTPFNRIFEGTYRRLPLKKDRPSKIGLAGVHREHQIDVVFKDNKWFPIKPFYDEARKVVYAQNHKTGEGYIGFLKSKCNVPASELITVRTDLSGEFEIPFNLENNVFAKGMAKIAAGYAALNGIDRENMKRILNLSEAKFSDEILAFPFFPVQTADSIFEVKAYTSAHYPIHGLSLIGIAEYRLLCCYVELFSTFQYIVIIDDEYDGADLHKTYLYDLINATEISAETYARSVIDNDLIVNLLKDYKNLSKDNLDEIADYVSIPEDIRFYTTTKFYQLTAFVAQMNMEQKLEILASQNH